MDIKLIRAFIASPGGLEAERRAAFSAAAEINRTVARQLNGRLELIGWEETISGIGRPQALINADMETCELFIGVMWSSWGSRPSIDGPYTSGFEEEFELSRERFERTQSPEMAMFFKDVEPAQKRDPGEELKKVLGFQEKLRNEKKFLYATFATDDDFAARVREFLSVHTIRLLTERDPQVVEEPEPAKPDGEQVRAPAPLGNGSKEAAFLAKAAKTMHGETRLDDAEVARLRLVAATSGVTTNDNILLGVHDANLLYNQRREFSFSSRERRGLIDTGLAKLDGENTPIWWWLAEAQKEMPEVLSAFTIFGEEAERIGAFKVIRLFGEPITPLPIFEKDLTKRWLNGKVPKNVRVAALQYLRDFGTTADLRPIEEEIGRADTDTLSRSREAYVSILFRDEPRSAVRYLLTASFDNFDKELLGRVLDHMSNLPVEELRRGLDHRSAEIRARSLQILSERGELDIETLGRAREDDSAIVRLAAIEALERLGQPISLDEARKVLVRFKRAQNALLFGYNEPSGIVVSDRYRVDRMRRMSPAQLKALMGAPEHRDEAYRILAARKIDDYPTQLRNDLRDHFRTYFAKHWPDGITPTAKTTLASVFTPSDPADDKRRELAQAAAAVVANQRDATDRQLLRSLLDDGLIKPDLPIVQFLRSVGDADDVPRLAAAPITLSLGLSDANEQRAFDAAAHAILKLNDGSFGDLMNLPLPNRMRARIVDFVSYADFAKLENEAVIALLLTDDDNLRRSIAKKVPSSMTRSNVRAILAQYRATDEGTYYLVTHWLDLGLAYPRNVARKVVEAKTR